MMDAWPDSVAAHIQRVYGPPLKVEPLSGMSGATVERLHLRTRTLILKGSESPRERLFYEEAAPAVRAAGMHMPRLEWSAFCVGRHWLLLEDIPLTLPPQPADEWRARPDVLVALARLHCAPLDGAPEELALHPVWDWTAETTAAALGFFPDSVAGKLRGAVTALQEEWAPLCLPECWIAGDASPPNWGLRRDGTAVLFDWEHFRKGPAAVDLAVITPGLPAAESFARTAAAYLEIRRGLAAERPVHVTELARTMALAKALTVVTMLRGIAIGKVTPPDATRTMLREGVPAWLTRLAEERTAG